MANETKRLAQYYEGMAAFNRPEQTKRGFWIEAPCKYSSDTLIGKEFNAGLNAAYNDNLKRIAA